MLACCSDFWLLLLLLFAWRVVWVYFGLVLRFFGGSGVVCWFFIKEERVENTKLVFGCFCFPINALHKSCS